MSLDLSKIATQKFGKNNELLVDKNGVPSIMVKIPKMRMKDLIKGGSENAHPAFIVDGREVDYIYISKYLNTVINGNAASIPLETPVNNVSYKEAKEYCENKGDGWHLMTNAEFSLLALLALRDKTMPYGNNDHGKSKETEVEGLKEIDDITLTGSGGVTWSNDNNISGIFDLNGNLSEWVSGLRLVDGQIQVLVDNNAAKTDVNTGVNSTLWRTINTDGSYGELEEIEDTYFYDYRNNAAQGGSIELTDSLKHRQNDNAIYGEHKFKNINQVEFELLKAIGLTPISSDIRNDAIRIRNTGERIAKRGGSFKDGESSGIFSLSLIDDRDTKDEITGFRACYIKP